MTGDKVAQRLASLKVKGRVIQTSLSTEAEMKLKAMFEEVQPMSAGADQLGRSTSGTGP
jgi:uncharacterized membrane protein